MKNLLYISLLMASMSTTLNVFSQSQAVDYKDGETPLKGYFAKAKSSSKKAPGIVIIH